MAQAGFHPDPWQAEVLRSDAQQISLLCGRQAGKTTVAAALAVSTALMQAGSLSLVLSPSSRQSKEFMRRVKSFYHAGDWGVALKSRPDATIEMELANGSRVVGLPDSDDTVRGFSGVGLLVIDEASRVSDSLYLAVRPMLAVSHGRILALSTPAGKRGWFWDDWHAEEERARMGRAPQWERYTVTAEQSPRIREFMRQEVEKGMPQRYVDQEFFCRFLDAMDAVFRAEDIDALVKPHLAPAFAWD